MRYEKHALFEALFPLLKLSSTPQQYARLSDFRYNVALLLNADLAKRAKRSFSDSIKL